VLIVENKMTFICAKYCADQTFIFSLISPSGYWSNASNF